MLQRLSKLKTALRNKQFINNSFLYLLLAAIVWVAYFHHSAKFGLYYEDYSRIPIAMEWTWSQLWNYLAHLPEWLIAMKYEGRPLHPSFIYFFSRLGEAIAGLQGIYVISYGVTTVNTFLFYSLINRLSAYPFFAFTSALAFALFPTNTNHAFLTSTLGVLPALTLILISFHLHLSKTKSSRITAYFLAFCSLFCYEKFLLVFFTAPLLKPKWDARVRQETIRHSLVLLLFIAIAVVARKLNGEGRVNQLELVALTQPLISLVIGPLATVFTFILRPIQSLISFQQDWVIPSLICFGLIAYTHFQLTTSRIEKNLSSFDNDFSSEEKSFFSKEHFFRDLAQYAIVGSLMLILAYPFTLTDSAFYISGRRSHVHVAAVVGASILCGCACLLVQFILRSRSRPAWLASSVLAAFFTLLIAFGFTV
ncbi:MAG TPA: hypothetical protein DEV81_09065, partial [Cyanobacteria bacterium UBA11049]|nr:hypothetical protein [Cyanobacteria bacterium UBA11049]